MISMARIFGAAIWQAEFRQAFERARQLRDRIAAARVADATT